MDYICKYLKPHTLVLIYDITKEEYYKSLAEEQLDLKIINLKDLKESIKLQINDLTIMWKDNSYSIFDNDKSNYIYFIIYKNTIIIKQIIITNVIKYSRLYNTFSSMFKEVLIKDYSIKKDNEFICRYRDYLCTSYVSLNKKNKLSVYTNRSSNKKIHKLL